MEDNTTLRPQFIKALLMLGLLLFLAWWGAHSGYYGHDKILLIVMIANVGVLFFLFRRTTFFLHHENDARRLSETALAKNEALLNALSNFGTDPVFVKDRAGRMIFANTATLNFIGKERSAVIGCKNPELFSDPEDSVAILLQDHLLLNGDETQSFEEIIHFPDCKRTFQVTKSPWIDETGAIGGVVGIASDITKEKHNENTLKPHETELEELVALRTAEVRELMSHLESTREAEKRALARELHDDMGSNLTALSMHLAMIFQKISSDPAFTDKIVKIQALLSSVTATTRRIQSGLRPDKLDIFGIKIALSELVDDFNGYTKIQCRISLPDEEITYGPELEITLFRMTQEILSNVVKHSKASFAEVILDDNDDYVTLTIRDDGIGMPEHPKNRRAHGLLGIRERVRYLGGQVEISPALARGTKISITLPKVHSFQALQ